MNLKKLLLPVALSLGALFTGTNKAEAQVSGYSFSQSSGTYVPLVSPNVFVAASSSNSLDSYVDSIATLPFSFNFGGTNFTKCYVSANGFMTFGTVAPSAGTSTPISTTTAGTQGVVSAWGRDINAVYNFVSGSVTYNGEMSWGTIGASPNRKVVMQWKNFRPTYTTSTTVAYAFDFQIILEETSNKVYISYGGVLGYLAGTTSYASTAQIGLRGSSTSDFNNRLNATSVAFSSSTVGTANSSTQAFSTSANPPGMPASGLTYTWTPANCFAPATTTVSALTFSTATLNWTAPTPAPVSGYEYEVRSSGAAGSGATGLVASGTTAAGITTANITGLSATTTYSLYIRGNCGAAGYSVWNAAITFTTPASCVVPVAATVSGVTSSTATLSWTAPSPAPSLGYDYEVRSSGAAGSGASGLAASGSTAAGITTVTVTGLSTLTAYTIYVRSNCGAINGFSVWTAGVNFFTQCTPPTLSGTTSASRCGIGTLSLAATGTGNTLYWYASNTVDTVLATGSPFITPVISATTTYYVATANATNYTGLGNTTIPTSAGASAVRGIVVQTTQPFRLNTAQFYSTLTTGTIAGTATLVDNVTGTTLTTTPFTFPAGSAAQWYTMNLNWNLAGGKTYRLLVNFSLGSVSRHSTGVDYSLPAYNNLGPVGTIISGYDGSPTASSYNYFHNMDVTAICASARTAVTATVTTAPAITASASATTICEGASATLSVTSANAGYTYNWTPATTPATGASVVATPIVTTRYFVNATDNTSGTNAGCANRDSVTITVNAAPTVPTVTPSVASSLCLGDTLSLSATGSLERFYNATSLFSENFDGGTSALTNVDLGSATTTPAKGAWLVKAAGYAYNSTAITSPSATSFIITNADSAGTGLTHVALVSPVVNAASAAGLGLAFNHYYRNYSGDSILVEASSDGGLNWVIAKNLSSGTAIGTPTGFVADTVNLDAFAGQANMKFRFRYRSSYGYYWAVDDVKLLSKNSVPIAWSSNPALGAGLPAGAGTASANNAMLKAVPTAAGTYTYTAVLSAANGCSRSVAAAPVTVNPKPMVALGADTSICAGTSTTLNAGNAGAAYLWSTGATTQSVIVATAGSYSVRVTNPNGCIGRDTINVTVSPLPVVNLGPDTSVCGGNAVTLNAGNAGSTYLWSTGATTQTIAVSAIGTYSVRVTNANGCIGRDTINVNAGPLPVVNLGNDLSICSGVSTTLNAGNAGASYLWSTGATTQTIMVSTAGSYSVRVTNAGGCVGRDTIVISVNPSPVVALGNDTAFCVGGSTTLNAGNAGASYLWSTGATTQTIAISAIGTYSVRVTNANGCIGRDTINVTVSPLPVVNLGPDTAFCIGNSVTLNAGNAGASYLWSTGDTTQSIVVSTAGMYSVRVTNSTGCMGQDTVEVDASPLPVQRLGNDTSFCAGGSVTLDAGNVGAAYLWSTGATTETITVSAAGTYSVRVTNPGGCVNRDTINISIAPSPVVTLGADRNFCAGSSAVLSAGNPGSTYLWSTGATTQTINVAGSGTYSVRVRNATGCFGRDTINITVRPKPVAGNITVSGQSSTFSFVAMDSQNDSLRGWLFGDGTSSLNAGQGGVTHTYTQTGTYKVKFYAANSCGVDTSTKTVIVTTVDVQTVMLDGDVSLFPNPASNYFVVQNNSAQKLKTITVLNVVGAVVQEVKADNSKEQRVAIEGLAAGSYLVRITLDGTTVIRRLQITQ